MARARPWWRDYSDVFENEFPGFENDAGRIRVFMPLVLPGLLQTQDYTEALFGAGGRPPTWQKRGLEFPAARQQILERTNGTAPRLVAVIAEAALMYRWGTRGRAARANTPGAVERSPKRRVAHPALRRRGQGQGQGQGGAAGTSAPLRRSPRLAGERCIWSPGSADGAAGTPGPASVQVGGQSTAPKAPPCSPGSAAGRAAQAATLIRTASFSNPGFRSRTRPSSPATRAWPGLHGQLLELVPHVVADPVKPQPSLMSLISGRSGWPQSTRPCPGPSHKSHTWLAVCPDSRLSS